MNDDVRSIVIVIDATHKNLREIFQQLSHCRCDIVRSAPLSTRVIVVANKSDAQDALSIDTIYRDLVIPAGLGLGGREVNVIKFSARTGLGVDALMRTLKKKVVSQNLDFFAKVRFPDNLPSILMFFSNLL